jgi:putative ABC transport system substrate-binding protein
VFASFESIEKLCKQAKVPIFTSEAGLVSRGALLGYGADIYQWGYQAGEQAAVFLQSRILQAFIGKW